MVVFKDNTVADIATEDCGANVSTPTRRSGGGIKIYSYAEQVARAAEKKPLTQNFNLSRTKPGKMLRNASQLPLSGEGRAYILK